MACLPRLRGRTPEPDPRPFPHMAPRTEGKELGEPSEERLEPGGLDARSSRDFSNSVGSVDGHGHGHGRA